VVELEQWRLDWRRDINQPAACHTHDATDDADTTHHADATHDTYATDHANATDDAIR
jgi:hypothetical protein